MRKPDFSSFQCKPCRPGENNSLWFGIVAGPMAWALHFQTSYALVLWVCKTGHDAALHVTSIACLLLALAGGVVAWLHLDPMPEPSSPKSDESIDSRARFMAAVGMMSSALFSLIIIAQAIPSFILSPCQK